MGFDDPGSLTPEQRLQRVAHILAKGHEHVSLFGESIAETERTTSTGKRIG